MPHALFWWELDSLGICEATKQRLSESYPAHAGILSESYETVYCRRVNDVAILVLVDFRFT